MTHAIGGVYVQTNDAVNNQVIVYGRGADGNLERLGSYATGGKGSGKPHLPSQSSVVVSGNRLFVTNAGSDDVTVFEPNISGFRLDGDRLEPVADSTHAFGEDSDPAQVAFAPDGRTLLVTDRAMDSIHTIGLDEQGTVRHAARHRSSGATPYGFDIRRDGTVVVTEAAGAQIGKASASSYKLGGPATLEPVTGAVGNTRSEVCWAVSSKDGRTAFVTNFGDGTISTYAIGEDGSIELRDAVAATTVEGTPGIRDEALSADGRFLYALHADTGSVYGWQVHSDGTLGALGAVNRLPLTAAGLAAS